jgi:hypothetical protein
MTSLEFDLPSQFRELTILEVFDYFDGPKFYSCKDLVGQLYLAYWIDQTALESSWLYVKVSLERYISFTAGGVSAAYAFMSPEDKRAYVVTSTGDQLKVTPISSVDISLEWLPPEEERFGLVPQSLPARTQSASDSAIASKRTVIDLAFYKLSNTYEMGMGKLGRIFDVTQKTVDALASGNNGDLRKVSEITKYNSELLVTGLFASSFGVRIKSKNLDLFSENSIEKALLTLTELISLLGKPYELSAYLKNLSVLSRTRFRHLLVTLIDADIGISTDWGAVDGRLEHAKATYIEIKEALSILTAGDEPNAVIVQRSGKLVGVDVHTSFFALALADRRVIKGTLDSAINTRSFKVPSNIVATLRESCVIDPITDVEKWSYVLTNAKEEGPLTDRLEV